MWRRSLSLVCLARPILCLQTLNHIKYRPFSTLCRDLTASHQARTFLVEQRRWKKGKDRKKSTQDEESDESDSDDDDVIKNFEERKIEVKNLRFDMVAKTGLRLTRASLEEKFFENKLRINGEKVLKKSFEVRERDEIDLILGRNPENPELLDVRRLIIQELPPNFTSKGSAIIKVRNYNLTIENYQDPYESKMITAPEAPEIESGKS